MKDVLNGIEQVIIAELKRRTGLAGAWERMGVSERRDFLDRLRSKISEVINAPAVRPKPSSGEQKTSQAGQQPVSRPASQQAATRK